MLFCTFAFVILITETNFIFKDKANDMNMTRKLLLS